MKTMSGGMMSPCYALLGVPWDRWPMLGFQHLGERPRAGSSSPAPTSAVRVEQW